MRDMNTSTRRTAKKLLDCFSWKGEDFDLTTPGGHKAHAKRMTRRARRRFDKALTREVQEVTA